MAVGHGISELKTQSLQEIDKEITTLKTKLMVKMNEDRQTTATCLQEIKDSLVAVQESQQRMWGTIERISNDLQELVRKDTGTEGEEDDTNQVLVTTNLNEEELALGAIPIAAPIQQPRPWSMTTIPEEEVASIKDSVISGLPSYEQNLGVEASDSGGIPVWSSMRQFRVYGQKAGNDA